MATGLLLVLVYGVTVEIIKKKPHKLAIQGSVCQKLTCVYLLDVKCQTLRGNTLHESFDGKFRGAVDSMERDALYSSLIA